VLYLGWLGCKCYYGNRVRMAVKLSGHWGLLQCILYGRPPILDLAHSDCRFPRDLEPHVLPSGSSELGCEHPLFLESIFFRCLTFFFFSSSPFMVVPLHCSLPQCISTTHPFRAPGELFIISRTRQAYPVIPCTILPSLSCVRD
jgi:hypothetical protein